jgi:hypothetical protein
MPLDGGNRPEHAGSNQRRPRTEPPPSRSLHDSLRCQLRFLCIHLQRDYKADASVPDVMMQVAAPVPIGDKLGHFGRKSAHRLFPHCARWMPQTHWPMCWASGHPARCHGAWHATAARCTTRLNANSRLRHAISHSAGGGCAPCAASCRQRPQTNAKIKCWAKKGPTHNIEDSGNWNAYRQIPRVGSLCAVRFLAHRLRRRRLKRRSAERSH